MGRIVKMSALVSLLFMMLAGNVLGGWFSFEPNILLLDGAYVARELDDIQKENAFREKGDIAKADQLIQDERVLVIESQKHETRVEYVKHKEKDNRIYVLVKDESGTKMWANMAGLVCQGANGSKRPVSKEDLAKGEFVLLSN
ncbi:MAG: hypothetical protein D3926_17640 [Desulfobacteraceae bacterium]|nr:MAG: hypothetical protein D3926_17640 [Desulfobacteraceae bacterium]